MFVSVPMKSKITALVCVILWFSAVGFSLNTVLECLFSDNKI
jgi:hypothetical protein